MGWLHRKCEANYAALELGRDQETDCYQQDILDLIDSLEKRDTAIEYMRIAIDEKNEELEVLRKVVVEHDRHCLPSL